MGLNYYHNPTDLTNSDNRFHTIVVGHILYHQNMAHTPESISHKVVSQNNPQQVLRNLNIQSLTMYNLLQIQ